MRIRAKNIALATALLVMVGCNGQSGQAAELLTVGSKAPALDIEHWVQDGGGKFKPVTKFESGKVYVVEFWATWCPPCVQSMPHLASLQKEFADRGVQIVSVSDEDLETVEAFLEQPLRSPPRGAEAPESEAKQTYRQLTSAYCLTTDPDQSTYSDYMDAAFQAGIPTAFIVGKKGTVEWIGHPMEMEEPLAAIIEDKWDAASFAAQFKPAQIAQYAQREVAPLLQKGNLDGALKFVEDLLVTSPSFELSNLKVHILLQKGDAESALKFVEELLLASPSQELKTLKLTILMENGDVDGALKYLDGLLGEFPADLELNGFKLQILLTDERHDDALKHVDQLFAKLASQPEQVNSLAWSIFSMFDQGAENMERLVELAIAASTKAADIVDGGLKANVLDTLAHLHFSRGEVDKAIALETTAVELAPDAERQYYKNYLDEITPKEDEER